MSHQRNDPLLRRAIEALASASRRKIEKHPLAHLVEGRRNRLELSLTIPLGPLDGALDDAVQSTENRLSAEIEALFVERTTFLPGRVYCLRCGSSDCAHARPGESREVFAGYGASGLPRFMDFAQWLLERQHPALDRIYEAPPGLVTEVVSGRELMGELLPAFRDAKIGFHVHGQLNAGWFPVRRVDGTADVLALSLQVLSSQTRTRGKRPGRGGKPRPRRRLMLNVLGCGPGGEPLEELYARLGVLPWQGVVQWGQKVLESVEKSQGRKSSTPQMLSKRIEGMLQSMARRLEQERRSRDRRTGHAEKRHSQGDRPTRMAFADLARGDDDRFLLDLRRETMIVLGERGRAHVFNRSGKLVTSIRYSPESIERKIRQEVWRPATAEEVIGLRKKTGVGAG